MKLENVGAGSLALQTILITYFVELAVTNCETREKLV